MAPVFYREMIVEITDTQLKRASSAAWASLLNLTVLPFIGFIVLLFIYKKTSADSFDRYYALVGLKVSVLAAIALVLVSVLIVAVGGYDSPLSWIYMLSYFLSVHALFILFTTWALVRAWSGDLLT